MAKPPGKPAENLPPLKHEQAPGRVRIISDGTPMGTFVEAIGLDGTWTRLRGVSSIRYSIEVDSLGECELQFSMAEFDVVAYREHSIADRREDRKKNREEQEREYQEQAERDAAAIARGEPSAFSETHTSDAG